MKGSIFSLLILIYSNQIFAQNKKDDDANTLNSLKASKSVAGNLLGFTASEITTISEPTVLQAEISEFSKKSSEFTVIPKSFAFDIAPSLLLKRNPKSLFLKNTILSIAYQDSADVNLNNSLPTNSKLAIGFGFNFWGRRKGKKEGEKVVLTLKTDNQIKYLNELNYDEYLNTFSNVIDINSDDSKFWNFKDSISSRSKDDKIETFKEINREKLFKAYIKNKNQVDFFRALTHNISGGLVLNQFTKKIEKGGFWYTASYSPDKLYKKEINKKTGVNDKKQNTFLFLARYLYDSTNTNSKKENKIEKFTNKNLFDIGLKYTYHSQGEQYYFIESELLYRNYEIKNLNNKANNKYKFDINLGYQLKKNFVLTASFGKDFGTRTINRTGNLFALLNLAGGIGRER